MHTNTHPIVLSEEDYEFWANISEDSNAELI